MEENLKQTNDPGLLQEMVITDLEAVRALTDPLKMKILEAIGPEPRTVKQIAASLKMVPNNLYYHINQLENLKLIRVVNTRVVSGIIEKQYAAAAISYTFSRSIISMHHSDKAVVRELMNNRILVLMEMSKAEMAESIQAGLLDLPLKANMTTTRHNLTQAQVDLMTAKVQELINSAEFEEAKDQGQEATHPYRMVVNIFPLVDDGTDEPD